MEKLLIERNPATGQIYVEMKGTNAEIAITLASAMVGSVDIASIVCAAIPIFLDTKGASREGYCKTVMDAIGGNGNPSLMEFLKNIKSANEK